MPHLKRSLTGAICAALCLWCASATPLSADTQPTPLTAIFIEARGELPDPNFGDSVVLVMNNLAPAPVGIIINRPTRITVPELFPEMKWLAQVHDRVYFGGPVEVDTVWFLFRAKKPPEHAVPACEGVYLSASREQLVKLLERDKPMDGLRIFIGHSGWGPGQLESEIQKGAWTLKHAEPDAIFQHKADHPWPAPDGPEPRT
jgi:putative transcriptional regulator